MTIKQLKKAIENAPDDAIFGTMDFANGYEINTLLPKRFLLLESNGKQMYVANNMGTHWNEQWAKENNAKYIGYADRDDEYKLHINQSTKV